MILSEFTARNNAALQTLIGKYKVNFLMFPDNVLNALGQLAGEVMDDYPKFRQGALSWSSRAEGTYLSARLLPFKYASPTKKG
jgi:hypothetical protein